MAMRMTELLGSTLREAPAATETASQQWLLRAGFIRQIGQGIYAYLPLGLRVMRKIEQIMREEMEAAGGVELSLPIVQPAELWRESGRWDAIGAELARFQDRRSRDLVLAMTHEEVVATLAASEISSWRDLPRLVYQIQLKFRDDPRPRAGLIRTREFTMKDAYSLDRDDAGLDRQYRRLHEAYDRIFERCGLPVIAVGADVGMMGGSGAHEFMYLTPVGEDTLVLCDHCGYAQNRQVAIAAKTAPSFEEARPTERVETPDATTIDALTRMLGLASERTAKVVFFAATGTDQPRFVIAVVRGDMIVNETKLANLLKADELRPMTDEEIVSVGCYPGFASPIGVGDAAVVVVDELVVASPNLAAGANELGVHLLNVNVGRDFDADVIADIVAAEDGDPCSVCGSPLRTTRGVEVGNIFRLGTKFSEAAGASYLDQDGQHKPIVMGSYGIGVGRLMACVAEEHHDADGLRWPVGLAPFGVHLCVLSENALADAEALYDELHSAGVEVLLDDRFERPGVQFADADLIGVPIRLVVSDRSLRAGGVEVKHRGETDPHVLPRQQIVEWACDQLFRSHEPSA
jgi:prolyl-tRNA synthetase